ncbi:MULTISPECIES: DUF4097 family beta strand repeat-containing protein [unclassified Streptomyces]|uniref:DUF4097 family beta strand repeat-containing protein n=1 Tax=unclassified Streptomyces TaxID=2593676 RepID=UPI002ED66539|nr:DUF4097 domain-containing protein [Streptomyces sp. NBC_00891]WSY06449.1 DUF4097 domain-containing protein [Streptomyces sp. NBC_00890]WSZ08073.1 DUF4097 domain-containing protein [Streptomyces sp. NBC_00869]WSZ24427.1 DUF4097 domain-containing protein [Streptomyces sp. NBC_00870]
MTSSWSEAKGRAVRAGCALVPLLALTACGHGGTDGRNEEFRTVSLAQGVRLVVTTQGGVRVVGTDGDRVTVDDSVLAHGDDGDGDTYTLDLPCDEADDRARPNCGGMPLVRVPSGVTLTVRARNAGIDVSDVRGGLSLSTVNGDVTVQDAGTKDARQHLVTRNGSVRATGLKGAGVEAETVNGDVDLGCATSPGTLDGVTRNGSVRVTLPAGAPAYATEARTVNGRSTTDVPAAGSSDHTHRLTLRTVNGDTEVRRG